MAFSVYEVICIACLLGSWFVLYGVENKPTMQQTSNANDFTNARRHASEKPLLAGYGWTNSVI